MKKSDKSLKRAPHASSDAPKPADAPSLRHLFSFGSAEPVRKLSTEASYDSKKTSKFSFFGEEQSDTEAIEGGDGVRNDHDRMRDDKIPHYEFFDENEIDAFGDEDNNNLFPEGQSTESTLQNDYQQRAEKIDEGESPEEIRNLAMRFCRGNTTLESIEKEWFEGSRRSRLQADFKAGRKRRKFTSSWLKSKTNSLKTS